MSNVHKVMKAWFTKKGGKSTLISKARKRWFVLDDRTINYYEKEDLKVCKGNIYVQNIKEVKTNSRELMLVTEYRTFSLTAANVEVAIEWAEAVEARLKDTEAVRKVVSKANHVIQKTISIEGHSKELCEYIEMLELENKELREENERMRNELEQRQGK